MDSRVFGGHFQQSDVLADHHLNDGGVVKKCGMMNWSPSIMVIGKNVSKTA